MWDSVRKLKRFAQMRAAGNKVESGAHVAFRKSDFMVLKWKDKKDVYMLSTKQ